MKTHTAWMSLVVGILFCGLAGCASQTTAVDSGPSDVFGQVPTDFSLEFWTLTATEGTDRGRSIQDQPLRLIVFPDGALHFEFRPNDYVPNAQWRPDITRQLDRMQLARVWGLLSRLGLADPNQQAPATNFNLIEPPNDGMAYALGVTGNGERWACIRMRDPGADADPAMVELISELAALAWADLSDPALGTAGAVRRYDFGPDPYAQYRR